MQQNKNLAAKLHKVWQLFSHLELKSRVFTLEEELKARIMLDISLF
jgi:hypothetical protein